MLASLIKVLTQAAHLSTLFCCWPADGIRQLRGFSRKEPHEERQSPSWPEPKAERAAKHVGALAHLAGVLARIGTHDTRLLRLLPTIYASRPSFGGGWHVVAAKGVACGLWLGWWLDATTHKIGRAYTVTN